METSQRASCWSITINNPSEGELKCDAPGWKLQGQFEEGNEGTRHFQGMLETPQVRFSAVKRVFPRAHIEVAKNKKALQLYVNKEETRVGIYQAQAVPNMFQLQDSIASDWDDDEWQRRLYINIDQDDGVRALEYLDTLVSTRIENGQRGIEFIAINPMWRSSWKKFWASIIKRNARIKEEADRRSNEESKEESP